MRKPKNFIALLGIYLGMGIIYFGEQNIPLADFLYRYGWNTLGGIIAGISFLYIFTKISPFIEDEEKFIDVDYEKKGNIKDENISQLIKEIEELKTNQPNIDYEKIEKLINNSTKDSKEINLDDIKSFETYFNSIRLTLEDKATIADKKASILLDKGTSYSKWGIIFFIFSIIIWQVLSWNKGFQTEFIYGIVSCSILFIFIEFLSAWFLKQYRQFVDTSTYLIKVKSIFDKYMLAYLLLREYPEESKGKLNEMLSLLRDDIKWPESYLLKNSDISFAKESMETMTYLLKNIKDNVRDNKSTN
jgi:hypothetical protein